MQQLIADIAISVQLSVYTEALNKQEIDELWSQLSSLINEKEDDIRIYPIKSIKCATTIGC